MIIKVQNLRTEIKYALKVKQKSGIYESPECIPEIILNYNLKKLIRKKLSLVTQVEYFEDEQHIYMVMKWANKNLFTFMRDNKVPLLTEQELRAPSLKIIKALQAIHDVGFIHTNIQPSNILIDLKYLPFKTSIKVKLCGLSMCIPIDFAEHVHDPPTTLFSAPEIIREGTQSVASDIWALGATLFTLANGHLPFQNDDEILTKNLDWSNRQRGLFDPDFV